MLNLFTKFSDKFDKAKTLFNTKVTFDIVLPDEFSALKAPITVLVVALSEKELLSIFQNIDKVLEMEENKTYTQISISVFNHWLSKKEFLEELNDVPADEQKERDAKHFIFSELLIKKMKIFGYIYLKKTEETRFVKFISDTELVKYMKQGSRFYIVIPEIESIYIYSFNHKIKQKMFI